MAWQYTPSDLALTNAVVFRLSDGVPGCGGGGSSGQIDFQFPPKVVNDSRKGTWEEGELRGVEPVAVFSTSGPREITIQTTYVVDGGEWNIGRISAQLRTLRGYFALIRDPGAARVNLVVEATLWCLLPAAGQIATGRLKSIDVKPSETLVYPPGDPGSAFPLRSDVTIDFRIWTKATSEDGGDTVQNITKLADRENQAWY